MSPLPSASAESPRSSGVLFLLAFAAVAAAASSVRFTLAPGFELYAAPFFFLIATRWFGLRVGLPAAIVLMLPTYFWWGHPFSIVMAAIYIVVVDVMRRRGRSFTGATLAYYLVFGIASGLLLLHVLYGAPVKLAAVITVRKLANDAVCAAIADAVLVFWQLDRGSWLLRRRRVTRISSAMLASMTVFVMSALSYMLLDEVRDFNHRFRELRNQISTELVYRLNDSRGPSGAARPALVSLSIDDIAVPVMTSSTAMPVGEGTALTRSLGCTVLDSDETVRSPDAQRFDFWVNACQTGVTRVDGRDIHYATSLKGVALAAYEEILWDITGYSFLALLGFASYVGLRRRLDDSVRSWAALVAQFGTPDLSVPSTSVFREFREAMDLFVITNNQYSAAIVERQALDVARRDLKRAIDLTIVSDIRYCLETGRLEYTTFEDEAGAVARSFVVHEADRQTLDNMSALGEVMIEFRIEGRAQNDWYMLVARDLCNAATWRAGCILKLRQAKLAEDRMAHQARLTELGGMASALSHEIKQPLFTIALAAENGLFQIGDDPSPPAQALAKKFTRIEEQVERARVIIDRISRYARIDEQNEEPFELKVALTAATSFMRPLLVRSNVRLAINFDAAPDLRVKMTRVGLEQIVVNAVQNSLDSIVARRAQSGEHLDGDRIDVTVIRYGAALEIRIADTGTGLLSGADKNAFDPFFTTKPAGQGTGLGLYISRQIMMEVGGSIRITDGQGDGAVVTVTIPAEAILPATVRKPAAQGERA